jgi:hypothetical protein
LLAFILAWNVAFDSSMRVSEYMFVKGVKKGSSIFKTELAVVLLVLAVTMIVERYIARSDVAKPARKDDIKEEDN